MCLYVRTYIEYCIFVFREVFKAREKKNSKKYVALKKVLMENEKEGVSILAEIFSFS
jgi:hypothetical protein